MVLQFEPSMMNAGMKENMGEASGNKDACDGDVGK